MRIIIKITFSLALLLSCGLTSCGSEEEKTANEMQQEGNEPDLADPVNPSTDVETADEDNGTTGSEAGGNSMAPTRKIVDNLSSSSSLSTLASALRQAGLVKTLSSTGPYTVFAPDNESFEALPNGTLEDLMKDENKQELADILNNHVIAGQITAENLQDGSMLKTIGGQQLKVTKRGEETMINGAKVKQADKMSSNGVIHVVDKVLMPEKK